MKPYSLFKVALYIFTLISLTSVLVAQEQPPVPLPDPDAMTCQATFEEQIQTTVEERRDDKLSDLVVVYLVTDQVDTTDVLSATNVKKEVRDIKVVTTWDEFLAIDAETPIQTVFIHQSALEIADKEWFHDAYRRAVSMILVDMTFGEYADLLGDYCTYAKYPAEGPAGGNPMTLEPDHYYIQALWILTAENEYIEQISAAELTTCNPESVSHNPYILTQLEGFDMVRSMNSFFRIGLSAGKVEQEVKINQYGKELSICLDQAGQE